MLRSLSVLSVASSCLLLPVEVLAGTDCQRPLHAEKARDWGTLFQRSSGWIGGDAADSVELGENRILWLFGDSLIGRIRDGRREIRGMARNAIALQEGRDPRTAHLRFFTGPDSFTEFFSPGRRGDWIWPCQGGIRTAAGLYLFLPEMTRVPSGSGARGFRVRLVTLVKITNPEDDPTRWIIRRYRMPFFRSVPGREERLFGIPAGRSGPWIIVSGHEEDYRTGKRRCLLARIRGERVEDFSKWEFRTQEGWSRNIGRGAPLCDDVGFERSLSWEPTLRRWLLVTSEKGLSDRILLRTSAEPWGPWSPPILVHQVKNVGSGLFSYAAKLHPGLDRFHSILLFSYVRNVSDLLRLSDPDVYRPEFVRIPLRKISGSRLP